MSAAFLARTESAPRRSAATSLFSEQSRPLSRFAAGVLGAMLGLGLAVGDSSPVAALDATTATVTSSANPVEVGKSVTFTARVIAAGSGAPTGSATFRVDGTDTATGALYARNGGKMISAGLAHVCALTSAGGARCWGYNYTGSLGDGTNTDRASPVDVVGLTSGVVAVGTGDEFSCALTDAGVVKCWGRNLDGQLGDGTRTNSSTPVTVAGLPGAASDIAVGQRHACALVAGATWCWGLDGGRLGDTAVADRVTPIVIAGLESGVARISAGYKHSCAILLDGAVKCWGGNQYGQLGDGGGTGWRMADVAGPGSGIVAIGAGDYHTCALYDGGGASCWGYGGNGQLGNGSADTQMTPVGVSGLTTAVALDVGYSSNCAVLTDGTAKCWGKNLYGQLGDGSASDRFTPVSVSGASDTMVIAAGNYMSCLQRVTGSLRCAGDDGYGELGDGSATTGGSVVPIDVTGLTGLLRSAAIWTTSGLAKGDHAIVAAYPGDAGHDASTSSTLTQTIDGLATTTGLASSKSPTKAGEAVTFTATVSASGGTPGGDVTLTVDGVDHTTETLVSGSFGFDVTDLAVGSHTIGARYAGDTTYAASSASTITQTVELGNSTTELTPSATTIRAGAGVTLTAAVEAVAPSAGSAEGGDVVFRDGATVLATIAVAGGSAILDTTSLTIGTHLITAAFQGTADLVGSTSGVATVTVDARSGAQFRANARTAGSQQYPAVAALAGGGWVVAWASEGQDGSSWGVYAQRYAANGAKSGGEFRVNTRTTDSQSFPAIAATIDGGFVVAWLGTGSTGKSTGIWAQRWSATGTRLGAEFRVDTTAGTTQSAPSLAASASGGFLVSWVSNNAGGTTFDVHTQLHDKTGKRVGAEVKANVAAMPAITSAASVAELPGGGWVVAWTSVAKAGAKPVVKAQRLTTKGLRSGGEIAVTNATWAQSEPVVAALPGEGFVVVWVSQGQDGAGKGLFAQRYTAAGAKLGAVFRVNLTVGGDQSEPSAVARAGGGFLVSWTSPDGAGKGIYCRLYAANGVPEDAVFRVNTTTKNDQWQSAASMLTGASFVVVWTSLATDGGAEGVYGQMFEFLVE